MIFSNLPGREIANPPTPAALNFSASAERLSSCVLEQIVATSCACRKREPLNLSGARRLYIKTGMKISSRLPVVHVDPNSDFASAAAAAAAATCRQSRLCFCSSSFAGLHLHSEGSKLVMCLGRAR